MTHEILDQSKTTREREGCITEVTFEKKELHTRSLSMEEITTRVHEIAKELLVGTTVKDFCIRGYLDGDGLIICSEKTIYEVDKK